MFFLQSLVFILFLSFSIFRLKKVNDFAIYSTVFILPAYYLIVISIGFLIYNYGSAWVGGFYDIGHYSTAEYESVVAKFYLILISFILGALIVSETKFSLGLRVERSSARNLMTESKVFKRSLQRLRFFLLPLSFCSIFSILIGVGFENVFFRYGYFPVVYPYLKTFGLLASAPLVFLIGYFYSTFSAKSKCFYFFVFFALLLIFFSLATRRLPITYLIFVFGFYVSKGKDNKIGVVSLLKHVVTTIFLLSLVLSFRNLEVQGLFPFFYLIFNFNQFIDLLLNGFQGVFTNLGVSLPLAVYVDSAYNISSADVFKSLNPLPGFVIGVGSIEQLLRYNVFIPYSAVGILFNYGMPLSCFYYFLIGIFFFFVDMNAYKEFSNNRPLRAILIMVAPAFFIIISLQYNLRGSTRMLYYGLFILILYRLFILFYRKKVRGF